MPSTFLFQQDKPNIWWFVLHWYVQFFSRSWKFLSKFWISVFDKILVNPRGRQAWFFDNVIWYDGWIGKSRFILPRHSFMSGTNCSDLQESIFLGFLAEDWHVKIKRANTKIDDFIWSVIMEIRIYHSWFWLVFSHFEKNYLISLTSSSFSQWFSRFSNLAMNWMAA